MKTDGMNPVPSTIVFRFSRPFLFFQKNTEIERGAPGPGPKMVEHLSVRIAGIPFSTRIYRFHPVFVSIRDRPAQLRLSPSRPIGPRPQTLTPRTPAPRTCDGASQLLPSALAARRCGLFLFLQSTRSMPLL